MAALTGNISFRDGGKTSELGINRLLSKVVSVNGVLGAGDLVVQAQASPDKTVAISTGDCVIGNLAPSVSSYSYHGFLSTGGNLTVTNNTSGSARIDTIVAYVDLSVVSSASNENPGAFKVDVVAGTPSGSPVAPDDAAIATAIGASNPFIRIANIAVANGFSSLPSSTITDVRPWMGAVHDARGWFDPRTTFTYASASTFTAPGDLTKFIRVGDCISITQTTVKYFNVLAVSVSSNKTTVTVFAGTDYTVANAAITSPLISHQNNPASFPSLFTCADAAWTMIGGTPGANANTGTKFRMSGREVEYTSGYQVNYSGSSSTQAEVVLDSALAAVINSSNFIHSIMRVKNPIGTITSYGGQVCDYDSSSSKFIGQVVIGTITGEIHLEAHFVI